MDNKYIIIENIKNINNIEKIVLKINEKFNLNINLQEAIGFANSYFSSIIWNEEEEKQWADYKFIVIFKEKDNKKEILNIAFVDSDFNLDNMNDNTDEVIKFSYNNLIN